MRPIFEQSPLAFRAPGGAVEKGAVVRAEARESGQIVRAGEDVDAVDLVQAEPGDGAAQVRRRDGIRAGRTETLRGEGDAAGKGKRYPGRSGHDPR